MPTQDERNRIDEIIRSFESSWSDGHRPRLESFLLEFMDSPAREELLRALLTRELELRQVAGETPLADDYVARFPGLEELVRATTQAVAAAFETTDHDVRPSAELPALDDYLVLEIIGQGSMGIVYKAKHRTLDRLTAIKVLFPGRPPDRFLREARLISRISSPRVVAVHDFRHLPDGRLALIMEHVEGLDLRAAMRSAGGVVPEERAVKWMTDVCDGMIAASERGIIHRDLKPANILIDRTGRALIADFGLARGEVGLGGMTLSDSVMGTPHYMAPEQAEDPRGVDTRADIYSFGATFYHVLTGSPPFEGTSIFSILCKHKTEPLISPRSRNPRITEHICSVIERCLAKAPGDRFPTFAKLREQITAGPGPFSPWDMTEDRELIRYLEQYQGRRGLYIDSPHSLPPDGDMYTFPSGRRIVILRGDLVHQAADAIVSSDTHRLSMDYGVALAIGKAGGPVVVQEARRYGQVRPGRAVVTSAGKLKAHYVFHGVTVGFSADQLVVPSRDLIAEIMASCFYHADSLQLRTIAFPLLGTGAMGFPRGICLDTMFQSLARLFLHGLTSLTEARIVLFPARA